jgi:alpha-L-fucosidase
LINAVALVHRPLALAALVAGLFLLNASPAPAQWSIRVDAGKTPKDMFAADDPRRNLPDYLFQPITTKEWEASNFAPAADVARFQDLRYGMFIHFGLSTYKGKDLSWGTVQSIKWPDHRADGTSAPPGPIHDEYIQWASQLRFEKFDADQWVRIARESGFHYIVAVAKHHEGFHLWDTAYSDFKITKTPFGRDYLKELSDACHKAGMPFGIYYAQREFYNPNYDPQHPKGERHQRYLEYNRNAVRELCTKYGKVDCFWFDAAWWGGMFTADMWDAEALTRMMRQLQPHMLINNRTSLPGDYDTSEQRSGYYQERLWEACSTLTGSWSWTGTPPESRDVLVRRLAADACANGNTLVSWGPHWNGAFDTNEVNRLREVGEWLKQNGASIYGTRGGPWLPASWGGSTRQGSTVYLHVLDPKLATLELLPIPARVEFAALMNAGGPLAFTQTSAGLKFTLPSAGRDPADTVIVLHLDQPVVLATVRSGTVRPSF